MKRDMNLVRRILEAIEADEIPKDIHSDYKAFGLKIELKGVGLFTLADHLRMLSKEGFITIRSARDDDWWKRYRENANEPDDDMPRATGLTWKGYDLLDDLRAKRMRNE